MSSATNEKKPWAECDVLVIGGGLAGSSAALAAKHVDSARVMLLEAEASLGGNSAQASSGVSAAGTPAQSKPDDPETHMRDTLEAGGDNDPELVETLAREGAEAVAWVKETLGVDLSQINPCGGHSVARTHRCPQPGVGRVLMKAAETALRQAGVEVRTNARVSSITQLPDGRAEVTTATTGDPEKTVVVRAKAVVVATGGFAGNAQALAKHAPDLPTRATTNRPSARGEGLDLLANVGARLENLDRVQLHPTGFVGKELSSSSPPSAFSAGQPQPQPQQQQPRILAPECLRGAGGVLLDPSTGRRFTDELARRGQVADAILALPSRQALLVAPKKAAEIAVGGAQAVGFYLARQVLQEHPAGWIDLCEAWGLPPDTPSPLFSSSSPSLADDDSDGSLLAGLVAPSAHYCMGGAAIDAHGRVLAAASVGSSASDGRGAPVLCPVWAAGEVTSGVHGRDRLAGNSLLECLVFGRRAGTAAAQHALALPDSSA